MLLLLVAMAYAGSAVLDFAPDSSKPMQVTLTRDDKVIVVETFKDWKEGTSIAVSADGKWGAALRGHMREEQALSIYDLSQPQRKAAVSMTSADRIEFSPSNTLILHGSCGTSCAILQVYDLAGKSLGSCGPSVDVAKTPRYALCYAHEYSDPASISLVDLATGQPVVRFPSTDDEDIIVHEVSWAPDESAVTATVTSRSSPSDPRRRLRLSVDGTSSWVE